MGFELIIASGIVAIICVYMFFKLGENTGNEHFIYQLLLFGLIIGSVVVLGGAGLKESTCELVATNSTAIDNTVYYQHDTICREPTKTEITYFELTQWFFRLSLSYIILYVLYQAMMYFGVDLLKRFKR